MHQLAIDGDIERAVIPGDNLDGAEFVAKLTHQGISKGQRLRFIAAFRAIGDGHFHQSFRRHERSPYACVTMARIAWMTSCTSCCLVASRAVAIACCTCAR